MRKFIISGGPGAGKSTLLKALQAKGFYGSAEVSRRLIQEQVALGSSCLPWIDLRCFAKIALDQMLIDVRNVPDSEGVAFFDRAVPDVMAYVHLGGLAMDESLRQAAQQRLYEPLVFMAPPWEAIYINDEERWQTFSEAVAIHQALVDTYQSLRFTVLDLPRVSVGDRVAFVLTQINEYLGIHGGTGLSTDEFKR